jgi:arylsulfatase A-like enzyme
MARFRPPGGGIEPIPKKTPLPFTPEQQDMPNVLMIVMDDVGVEQLRCFGSDPTNSYAPTPNIDRLARNGVRFPRMQVMPVCSPTRASLLTGRFPFRTGIGSTTVRNQRPLFPTETCLPRAIQQSTGNAVRTGCFGKWHISTFLNGEFAHPNDVGFEDFRGAMANFERGEDDYYAWQIIENGVARRCTVYSPTQNVNDALNWIHDQASPWFCYVPFNTIHDPIHRPPAHLYDTERYVLPHPIPDTNPAEDEEPYFKAMIQAMDSEIGRLIDSIPAAVRNNTVIILLSDNGTAGDHMPAGFPASHNKGSVFELGVRSPLIVSGPGIDRPGRISTNLVNAVDLYYTVIDLFNGDRTLITAAGTVDSVSFSALLSNANGRNPRSPGAVKNYSFVEIFGQNGPNSNGVPPGISAGLRAVTGDRYKLHVQKNDFTFPHTLASTGSAALMDNLYDLYTDPYELTSLLDNGDPGGIDEGAHPGATAAYNAHKATFIALLT